MVVCPEPRSPLTDDGIRILSAAEFCHPERRDGLIGEAVSTPKAGLCEVESDEGKEYHRHVA